MEPILPSLVPTERPDRVTIVALEDSTYRADVSFCGATAELGAHHLDELLRAQELRSDVRLDSDGAWTVRVGPSQAWRLLGVLRSVLA